MPNASRKLTRGRPMLASTPSSVRMRSIVTSRCSSPMPFSTVWPVSWSTCEPQRRVGLDHLVERGRHLVDVGARLRLDGHADDGVREAHALEQRRMIRIRQRIAGLGFLHRDERADVAGARFVDVLGRGGLDLDDAADALLLAARDVGERVALLDDARVDAHERQRAELVVDDLERERARRRVVFDFLRADDLAVRDRPCRCRRSRRGRAGSR